MESSSQEPVRPEPTAPERDRRETARTVFGIAVLVVAVVFAVVNLDSVKVDWIVGSSHAPLIIVIAISVIVGLVLGRLGERSGVRRRRRR
jgi:uncharacterized integral membrane protein